jgi:hypothetical protein
MAKDYFICPKVHYCVYKIMRLGSILSHLISIHTHTYILKIYLNSLLPSMPISPKWSLYVMSETTFLYKIFLSSMLSTNLVLTDNYDRKLASFLSSDSNIFLKWVTNFLSSIPSIDDRDVQNMVLKISVLYSGNWGYTSAPVTPRVSFQHKK